MSVPKGQRARGGGSYQREQSPPKRPVSRDLETVVQRLMDQGVQQRLEVPFGHLWGPYLSWFDGKYRSIDRALKVEDGDRNRASRDQQGSSAVAQSRENTEKSTSEGARALARRGHAIRGVLARRRGSRVQTFVLKLSSPLALGLGVVHPEGMGMSFSYPHGLPRIPGSSLKGVVRAEASRALGDERADSPLAFDQRRLCALFGWAPGSGEAGDPCGCRELAVSASQGHLLFLDAFPYLAPEGGAESRGEQVLVELDVVTPHHTGYLSRNEPPLESELPTPVLFPVVTAGARIDVDVVHLGACEEGCVELVRWLFERLSNLGALGARSSVGYGEVELDRESAEALVQDAMARRQAEEREAQRRLEQARQLEAQRHERDRLIEQLLKRFGALSSGASAELWRLLEHEAEKVGWSRERLSELVVVRVVLEAIESGDAESLRDPAVCDGLERVLVQAGLWLPHPRGDGKPYKQRQLKGHELSKRVAQLRREL